MAIDSIDFVFTPSGRAALWYLVGIVFLTFLVYLSGYEASHTAERLSIASHSVIHAHQTAATYGVISAAVLGALALGGIFYIRRDNPRRFRQVLIANTIVAFLVSGVFAWVANVGGKVHHEEIRPPGYLGQIKEHEQHK